MKTMKTMKTMTMTDGSTVTLLDTDPVRVAVVIPDDDAHVPTADGERDYGHADWPADEDVDAAASALLGRPVRLRFFDAGDSLCEVIYHEVLP